MASSVQDTIMRAMMNQGGGGVRGFGGDSSTLNPGGVVPRRPMGAMPSPGLGIGTPPLQTYEDMSMGYPGTASPNPGMYPNGAGDPLLVLLQTWLNNRFPNGM